MIKMISAGVAGSLATQKPTAQLRSRDATLSVCGLMLVLVISLGAFADEIPSAGPLWQHRGEPIPSCYQSGFVVLNMQSKTGDGTSRQGFMCVSFDPDTCGREKAEVSPLLPGPCFSCFARDEGGAFCNVGMDNRLLAINRDTFEMTGIRLPGLSGRPYDARRIGNYLLVQSLTGDPRQSTVFSAYGWEKGTARPLVDWLSKNEEGRPVVWNFIPTQLDVLWGQSTFIYTAAVGSDEWPVARLRLLDGVLYLEPVLSCRVPVLFCHPAGEWFVYSAKCGDEFCLYLIRPGEEEQPILEPGTDPDHWYDFLYLPFDNVLVVAYSRGEQRILMRYDLDKGRQLPPIETDSDYTLVGWNYPTNELILYSQPDLMRYSLTTQEWSHMATVEPPEGEPEEVLE